MPAYTRPPFRYTFRGVNLAQPIDTLPDGDYPAADNIRITQQGGVGSRPGSAPLYPDPILDQQGHSIRRLNSVSSGSYARILGFGPNLYHQSGSSSPTLIDSGYSGSPLSLIPFRPDQSVDAWMYVSDANKMVKVDVNGVVKPVGYFPSSSPPEAEITSRAVEFVADFQSSFGWTPTGSASPPSSLARGLSVITSILYDSGTSGYFTFTPAAGDVSWIKEGVRILIGADPILRNVEQVTPAIPTTSISSVDYDSGSTGPCTIVLGISVTDLQRNSLLSLNSSEVVRVLSVSRGPGQLVSIRTSTVITHFPAETVTGQIGIRVYGPAVAFSVGDTFVAYSLQLNLTAGTGMISALDAVDLSRLVFNSIPTTPSDYMHISFKASDISAVVSLRLLLDVDSTTNNFTRNYYERVITQDELNQSGDSDWSEITFRLSELTRIGTDYNRNLSNVTVVALEVTTTAAISTFFSSWWVAGGYGPDVEPGTPTGLGIVYRFRYRDSTTGAKSIPSPSTRYGLVSRRNQVTITCVGTSQAGVDQIDIERLDPLLQSPAPSPPSWHFVGSVSNSGVDGVTVDFIDTLDAASIAVSPPLATNCLKPFPVLGSPVDTIVNITGTAVRWISGDTFQSSLVPGTIVTVNGVANQIYSVHSPTFLELVYSAGFQLNARILISSPIYMGTVLPIIFGPLEGPSATFLFGVGDPTNPGTLYWTNPNDPDSASSSNFIEVTSPSEALETGCVWNNYVFVGSRERPFQIQPNFDSVNPFTPTEIPGASGFWSKWAIAEGIDGVYYLGRDGIYRANPYYGGQMVSPDLWSLFPHEGQPAVLTNGYFPIQMNSPASLRMSVCDSEVYFTYSDTEGNISTWVSSPTQSQSRRQDQSVAGWRHYVYTTRITHFYWEEAPDPTSPLLLLLTNTGLVGFSGGLQDFGQPYSVSILTPFQVYGDTLSTKLFSEQMIDADNGGDGSGFSVALYKNLDSSGPLFSTVLTAATGRTKYFIDLNGGLGYLVLSASLRLTWTENGGPSTSLGKSVYEWQPAIIPKPPFTHRESTDWTDDGKACAKYLRGVVIEANTFDPVTGALYTRNVRVEIDGGVALPILLSVTHNGQLEAAYGFFPVVTHEMRLVPLDAGSWELFTIRWVWDEYPEFSTIVPEDFSDLGEPGTKYVTGVVAEIDTQNSPVQVAVEIDGGLDSGTTPFTLACLHNGRVEVCYSFSPPFLCHSLRLRQLGNARLFNRRWIYDKYPEMSRLYSFWSGGGTSKCKYVRGVRIRVDTNGVPVQFTIQKDGGGTAVTPNMSVTATGQEIVPLAFSTPFTAYLMRLVPSSNWRLWDQDIEWIYDEYPDLTPLITPWTDDGYPGAKWLQGMVYNADTGGSLAAITVEGDASGVIASLAVSHTGQVEKAYSWEPIVAHNMRLVPTNPVRSFHIKWVWEPHPELAMFWVTQPTNFGWDWAIAKDAVVMYQSTDPASFILIHDGVEEVYDLPSSPLPSRRYLLLRPHKGRQWGFRVDYSNSPPPSGVGLRLFKPGTLVRMKSYGGKSFIDVHPFGETHALDGAKI